MRRESDIPVIFSGKEEEGFLKKGTGINSIFKKLKKLSRNRDYPDNTEVETDDDQHISLSAEDSDEPEVHSVTIYDSNGSEATRFDTDCADRNGTESVMSESTADNGVDRVDEEENYEVKAEELFETPQTAPGFVSQDEGSPIDYPETVFIEEPDPLYSGEVIEIEGPYNVTGDFDEMHEEHKTDVAVDDNAWEAQDTGHPHNGAGFDGEANETGHHGANSLKLTSSDLEKISSPLKFVKELKRNGIKADKFEKKLRYEQLLRGLQLECSKLQQSVKRNSEKVIVIFEGMELSGKYDTIRKITKYMDPTGARVVSLGERSDAEKQEWFFERYTKHLPKNGEMVFFNRSWYDRGVMEPVHGLCSDEEYGRFLTQAPEFEYMLIENGYKLVKIWLSVTSKQQNRRLQALAEEGLANWKLSPFDDSYLERWSESKKYRNLMFSWTDKNYSPWIIISSKKRKKARLESMRHILSTLDYDGKQDAAVSIVPNAMIVRRFHRSMIAED